MAKKMTPPVTPAHTLPVPTEKAPDPTLGVIMALTQLINQTVDVVAAISTRVDLVEGAVRRLQAVDRARTDIKMGRDEPEEASGGGWLKREERGE